MKLTEKIQIVNQNRDKLSDGQRRALSGYKSMLRNIEEEGQMGGEKHVQPDGVRQFEALLDKCIAQIGQMKKQTKYTGMPLWSDMADELFDSDGCHPDADSIAELMREFRDTGGIGGFFFCTGPCDENGMCRDSWHNGELRPAEECGPAPDEINYTGLN
ncbi:MAG: hypothetical protein LLF76_08065 [Planctomycetaceae bacterium]|nr:hypothetical protein [Planctomycetaceae bacterium]